MNGLKYIGWEDGQLKEEKVEEEEQKYKWNL